MRNQASNREYDVIVVGSGAGGAATVYRLVQAGIRVLLVEKGERLPKNESTLDVKTVIHDGAFKSREPWCDRAGRVLVPEEYFNFGGKTKWYGAALAQFQPAEFLADAERQYLGWPCRYDEMRPYYEQAEVLLGIREFGVEPALTVLLGRLARRAPSWHATPLRLGLKRQIVAATREAAHFDGFASPTGLKSEAESALLDRVAQAPNLSIVTGHAVTGLVGDAQRPMTVRGVRIDDGRVYRARETVLAAGALHSPRLLGRYLELTGLERLPIAATVGRYLKLHHLTAVLAVSASPKTDLLRKTTLLLHDELPHSSVQPLGFDGELIATLIPRYVPRSLAAAVGARAYGFFLQTEDGSSPDNRVIGEGAAGELPRLDYDPARVPSSRDEHRRLVRTLCRDLRRAGYLALSQTIGLHGTAHACGTLRAGIDPHDSVVDAMGRVHGLEGLSVADGSVLPRSSRVNPALTIYAWGLRIADVIARRISRELSVRSAAASPDIAAPEVVG